MGRSLAIAIVVLGASARGAETQPAATVYRISELYLRDPHIVVDFPPFCSDVTDTALFGLPSFNSFINAQLDDELLDFSLLAVLRPLDQSVPGSGGLELVTDAACTEPIHATTCGLSEGSFRFPSMYNNLDAATCLEPAIGTTFGYTPAVPDIFAPPTCFFTPAMDVLVPVGFFALPLKSVQIAANFSGTPATSLTPGLLRGFLTKADADTILLPASFPAIGGDPVSSVLPGPGHCETHSDLDTGPGPGGPTDGWWFYFEFVAEVVPYVDLRVTQTDAPDPVAPGFPLTYSLTITNAGTAEATGVSLADGLPSGALFSSVTASQGTCSGGAGAAGCSLGNLAGGSSATVTIEVTPLSVGTITNSVAVSATEPDLEPVDNSSITDTTVALVVDLAITKNADLATAVAGEPIAYTIVASNAGPSDVTGVRVQDTFPSELTSCSWTCSEAGGASCAIGPVAGNLDDMAGLPAGGTATYTASCTVDPSATSEIANTASVSHPTAIDMNTTNNAATDTTLLAGLCGHPDNRVLEPQEIDAPLTLEACQSITAGNGVLITATGNLTLRSGGSAILANGFSMVPGAALTVEILR